MRMTILMNYTLSELGKMLQNLSSVAVMIWHIKDLYYISCYAETNMSESFKNAQTILIETFHNIDAQLFFYKDLIKYRPFLHPS